VEGIAVTPGDDGERLSGDKLRRLLERLILYSECIQRLEKKGYQRSLIEVFLGKGPLDKKAIEDHQMMDQIEESLRKELDFKRLTVLSQQLEDICKPPFVVLKDGEAKTLDSRDELLKHFVSESKKGLSIQRYKGLGEMNPNQLWQTTMDPETRTLLRVKIEDALETDSTFTVLMGEKVEPRREFIQNNALEVKELDI
jgi:DNA gyrase subunit B